MWDQRISVALRTFSILDFVRIMERIVSKAALCSLVPRGRHYVASCPEVAAGATELYLDFTDRYLLRVVRAIFESH